MIIINPKYEEFFHERLTNFLYIVYKSMHQKYKNLNISGEDIENELDNAFTYLTNKKHSSLDHNISSNLLSFVNSGLIIPILDTMYEDFILEKDLRAKIVKYAIDLFVADCYTYNYANLDDLEILV